jgi:hypothetical protein
MPCLSVIILWFLKIDKPDDVTGLLSGAQYGTITDYMSAPITFRSDVDAISY